MRFLLFVVAVVSCSLGTSQASSACSCFEILSPLAAMAQADVVFTGTVIEIDEQPSISIVKFKVDRAWKGVDGDEATIVTSFSGATCGYLFALDEAYLVYGRFGAYIVPAGEFPDTGLCDPNKLLSEATEDIETLGEPSLTLVKPTFWGQIKALFY